jgi:hypothetical protein
MFLFHFNFFLLAQSLHVKKKCVVIFQIKKLSFNLFHQEIKNQTELRNTTLSSFIFVLLPKLMIIKLIYFLSSSPFLNKS